MRGTARPREQGLGARARSWFAWLAGIVASATTIAAAVASLVAVHQSGRVNQLNIIVAQQRHQLEHLGVTPAGSGATSGAPPSAGTYLSALQPTVDHASLQTGSQTIAANQYPDSVTFGCYGTVNTDEPDEAFDVAGHRVFRAVVGIPDNAQNATSLDETVSFANQGGTNLIKPVVVSLGHPATVRLSISDVTQLEITCSGTDPHTQQTDNNNEITLGDAYVSG